MKAYELPEFKALVKKKWRVSLLLTIIMLVIYFGFILLIAFDKTLLARLIGKNITLGLPIGLGILVVAWLLTGIYVLWANRHYDRQVEEIKKKIL
jgi:uncharacterized membrane protein (DUF485 family)